MISDILLEQHAVNIVVIDSVVLNIVVIEIVFVQILAPEVAPSVSPNSSWRGNHESIVCVIAYSSFLSHAAIRQC